MKLLTLSLISSMVLTASCMFANEPANEQYTHTPNEQYGHVVDEQYGYVANEHCGHAFHEECCHFTECCYKWYDGFSFSADGLYLKAYQDNLQFASLNDFSTDSSIPNVSNQNNLIGNKSPSFSTNWGYRLGLNYQNPCSCWSIDVDYFHYRTSAKGRLANIYSSASSPTRSNQTSINVLYSINQGGPFDYCRAHLGVKIDYVDVDIKHLFCWNECFNLRPFIGLRFADISQKYKIRAEGTSIIARDDPEISSIQISNNKLVNNYHGMGLHAGFDLSWQVARGFSIYGNCAGSILYGRSKINSGLLFTSTDFVNDSQSITSLHAKNNQSGAKAIFEAELGIDWTHIFNNGNFLRLRLGWNNMIFFNSNRFENAIVFEKTSALAIPRYSDLGLQGLVFGADVSF